MELMISFCTTCMDRIQYLKYTLPTNIEVSDFLYPNVEFILVDYDSKDGLEGWVKKTLKKHLYSGVLRYYKVTGYKYFNRSHAKNIAHKQAKGNIVCNLDADNFISVEFIETVLRLFERDRNIILHGTGGAHGKVCLMKNNFLKLGGYNEDLVDWGVEDIDLLQRAGLYLKLKKYKLWQFDLMINHDHEERTKKAKGNDLSQMWDYNIEIAHQAIKKKQYVANVGREWGVLN